MKKIRGLVSIFLAAVMLLCGATVVCATENEVDWANYDWENFSFVGLEHEEWIPMREWLRAEADLDLLFNIRMKSDGYFSEDMSGLLYERFKKDPVGVIAALSLEEETVQTHILRSIVYAGAYYPTEFTQLMNDLTLPEDAGPEAMNILVQMVKRAEETWGLDITNPHTGDPIGLAALLMAFSGLGTALLWKKRRMMAV